MRTWTVLGLGLVIVTYAAGADKDDKAKEDKQKLQGTWKLISFEVAGKGDDDTKDENRELVIDGDKITVKNEGKEVEQESFVLDPTKKPKNIEVTTLTGDDKNKKRLGIYELDGDNLKICIDEKGEARPAEFKTKEGGSQILVTLKRVKK
ncbi:MAG TPA: TIGR03067 domain-containing protein [Gemmataceae bacterium]|nr:TIGR03067 domain-containing protein [Gemmataceae bacterium]